MRTGPSPSIAVTGGGTGGHAYPALSVIEALGDVVPCARMAWIGSRRGIEARIAATAGIPYLGISTGKLRRYLSARNVWDVFRVLAGILRSLRILRALDAGVVFSKGGYVAVPLVLAARILRIPVVCHESDLSPGLATRISARVAASVCTAYPETARALARTGLRTVVSGNPVRSDLLQPADAPDPLAAAGLSRPGRRPLLLVQGGSQGARQLNGIVGEILDDLLPDWDVIHSCGRNDPIPQARRGYLPCAYFSSDYAAILQRADVVLCRAGAGSLWEAALCNSAMILVPLSLGSRGDQLENAEWFAARGAAINLGRTPGAVDALGVLQRLAQMPEERGRLARTARSLVNADAAAKIADEIVRVLP